MSNELASVVEKSSRAIATIHGRPRMGSSGVIWQPGVIVTAEHTVRREEDVRVTLPDGNTVKAQIAGRDPGTDLAVLRVDTSNTEPLPHVREPKVGNLVLSVGRSADTGTIASLGVISGVSGPWQTWRGGKLDVFIRLDVNLYGGAVGGAAVSAAGELVGLATAGLSRSSILAVPIPTITRVVSSILEKGHVSRGYLGIGLQPVAVPANLKDKLQLTTDTGLIVLSVEHDGPAGQAGLVIGDVLVALDGKHLADTDDVQAVLGPENVGKALKALVVRGGEKVELTVTVGERPRRRS